MIGEKNLYMVFEYRIDQSGNSELEIFSIYQQLLTPTVTNQEICEFGTLLLQSLDRWPGFILLDTLYRLLQTRRGALEDQVFGQCLFNTLPRLFKADSPRIRSRALAIYYLWVEQQQPIELDVDQYLNDEDDQVRQVLALM